jgi:hypothetical protein
MKFDGTKTPQEQIKDHIRSVMSSKRKETFLSCEWEKFAFEYHIYAFINKLGVDLAYTNYSVAYMTLQGNIIIKVR